MKLYLTDKDGYEAVSDIIKEWAEKNQPYVYCAYIVDIQTPNGRNMEYVEYDISDDCWIWQNDWWEGEDEIELFGFAPLDEIELPDKWQIENLFPEISKVIKENEEFEELLKETKDLLGITF